MADSDRPDWPQRDRRARAERRTGLDRRAEPLTGSLPFEIGPAGGFAPEEALLASARTARTCAQADYSRFLVGAALETMTGTIVTGCNVESATYGLTICAERVALVKALSDGHTRFVRLAVVADTDLPTPPCGACRQLLWEYCGDITVFLGNLRSLTGHYRLRSLLPLPFDRTLLK